MTMKAAVLIVASVGAALSSSCGSAPSGLSSAPVIRMDGSRVNHQRRALNDEFDLGRSLFEDNRLSRDSSISCATCHMPSYAFAEPRPVSHGVGIRARKRNAPSLINVIDSRSGFDWDGRAATLEDQLRGVFSVTGDMGISLADAVARAMADSSYQQAFARVYGRPLDVKALLSALVSFQRALVIDEPARFEEFYFGGDSLVFSDSERRGWRLFRARGCAGCHVPLRSNGSRRAVFTDGRFHNLGVGYNDGRMADLGRAGVTRRPSDWGSFKTPSLRNVALTAPYMHDGGLATLEDVVEFYAKGGIKNPNLDVTITGFLLPEQDRSDLVAFLKTLTTKWLADSVSVRRALMRNRATMPGSVFVR